MRTAEASRPYRPKQKRSGGPSVTGVTGESLNPRFGGCGLGVTAAAKPRGNGRLARFPKDHPGGTPVPPAQARSRLARRVRRNSSYSRANNTCRPHGSGFRECRDMDPNTPAPCSMLSALATFYQPPFTFYRGFAAPFPPSTFDLLPFTFYRGFAALRLRRPLHSGNRSPMKARVEKTADKSAGASSRVSA